MQVFPRETTDYIASQFCDFYDRKRDRNKKLSYKDADKIISNVIGPAEGSNGLTADYTKPRVTGGGRVRPTDAEVDAIILKYHEDEPDSEWDGVFESVLRIYEHNTRIRQFIRLVFDGQYSYQTVCDEFHISEATYYNYRVRILTQSAIVATLKGLVSLENISNSDN